jgi:hypothetical protein
MDGWGRDFIGERNGSDKAVAAPGDGRDISNAGVAVAQRPAQRTDLELKIAFLDNGTGPSAGDQLSLLTTSPRRSIKAIRMSSARLPRRTGALP